LEKESTLPSTGVETVDTQLVIEEIVIVITFDSSDFTPFGSASFFVGLGERRTVSNVPNESCLS
jgi:hypothetical protein